MAVAATPLARRTTSRPVRKLHPDDPSPQRRSRRGKQEETWDATVRSSAAAGRDGAGCGRYDRPVYGPRGAAGPGGRGTGGWGEFPESRRDFPRGRSFGGRSAAMDRGWDAGEPWGGESAADRLRAADIMTANPEAVTPDTSLSEVAALMRELDVGDHPRGGRRGRLPPQGRHHRPRHHRPRRRGGPGHEEDEGVRVHDLRGADRPRERPRARCLHGHEARAGAPRAGGGRRRGGSSASSPRPIWRWGTPASTCSARRRWRR